MKYYWGLVFFGLGIAMTAAALAAGASGWHVAGGSVVLAFGATLLEDAR